MFTFLASSFVMKVTVHTLSSLSIYIHCVFCCNFQTLLTPEEYSFVGYTYKNFEAVKRKLRQLGTSYLMLASFLFHFRADSQFVAAFRKKTQYSFCRVNVWQLDGQNTSADQTSQMLNLEGNITQFINIDIAVLLCYCVIPYCINDLVLDYVSRL